MEGRLVFKFGDNLQLSFDQSRFAPGDMIKFGQGFEDMEILFQGPTPSEARTLESQPSSEKRVLEINLPARERSPTQSSRKRVAELSPKALASRPSVFNRLTFPKVLKSDVRQTALTPLLPKKKTVGKDHVHVQPLEAVPVVPGPESLFQSSQYEEGGCSTYVLTRSQKRNKYRRYKKRMEKEEKAELEAEMMELSPLAEGSRFYPLSVSRGEEDVRKIAASPPRPPPRVSKSTPEERKKQWEKDIRRIFQRVADQMYTTKEAVIKAMKNTITEDFARLLLKEDRDPEDSRLIVQPTQNDRHKFSKQPAVSALTDGYGSRPRQKRPMNDQIVLVDYSVPLHEVHGRPKADLPDRRVVPRTSLSGSSKSDVPNRFRRSPKEDGHPTPHVELPSGGRIWTPPLDEMNVGHQKPHTSSSKVKKGWRPKLVTPPVVHSPPPVHVDPKDKGKTPMEVNSYEEYHPSDVNPSTGKTIEEMMDYLKDSLKKIDEEEKREKEEEDHKKLIENFNPDEDDLLDEEDIFVLQYSRRESSLPGDPHTDDLLEVEVEEEGSDNPQIRDLLQQLKNKDAQLSDMTKRLDEMASAMTALTTQLLGPQKAPNTADKPSTSAEKAKEVVQVDEDIGSQEKNEPGSVNLQPSKEDLKDFINQQIKESMAHGKGGHSIQRGRPYPEEFDSVQYPKGFVAPSFKLFDGVGNPRQHLAHFRAGCCNVGGSDALLFRQFVSSLSGVAFDWYAELPNGSVKTFAELEALFVKRFAGAQHHITVGDLVVEKQKPSEGLVDYILRWRNLSLKCEPQLQEQHAIEILLRNIHGPIALILKGFTIKTFEKLLSKASSLQSEAAQLSFLKDSNGDQSKKFKQKIVERKGSVSALSLQKGKQIQITEQQSPRKISEQPRKEKEKAVKKPDPRGLTEKINQQYSFRRDATKKIFKSLIQDDNFQLPKPKRPTEVDKSNEPNYCPYHRMLGHVLEDCYVFKDWVENEYKSGRMSLPDAYLANPSQGSAKVVHVEAIPTKGQKTESAMAVSSPTMFSQKGSAGLLTDAEGWQLSLSKSSFKMLNKLSKAPLEFPKGTQMPIKKAFGVPPNNSMDGKGPSSLKLLKERVSMVKGKEKEELTPQIKQVILPNGKGKSPKPITLSDFMYVPKGVNEMNNPSAYVLSVHSESENENETESSQLPESSESSSDDDLPMYKMQGVKIVIEPESPDLETNQVKEESDSEVLVDVTSTSDPEQITEINLRSGRVVPSPMASKKDKGKEPVNQNEGVVPPTLAPQEQVGGGPPKVDYNVLAHLRKLPARLSIYDALVLSPEMREALIKALLDPEICLAQLAECSPEEALHFKEMPGVTFSDEDLLLGTSDHNRPLYITVDIDNYKLNRVLVDPGASVNIMSLRTLAHLNVDTQKLSSDKMMLRGFNEKGERALGSVTLSMLMGDLRTEAKFHIIDSETSFRALLGRPWLHEYKMVPSSLHQCVKYERNGVEYCIKGDLKPFGVHEVGKYEDASYYVPKRLLVFSRSVIPAEDQLEASASKEQAPTLVQECPQEELEERIRWNPAPPSTQRGGRMAQRARGRDRGRGGRGQDGWKMRTTKASSPPPTPRRPITHVGSGSNSKVEPNMILKVYPFPMTISAFQFAFGSIVIFIMWSTNVNKRPKISTSQLATILPLAVVHTLGNLFTNMSLGKVAVSFTHTIKAMEPFFSVLFSALFLGELPTIWIISSLVPIVSGVALASLTEASFNWPGFWSAMASNVTNQYRNVLSKKLMAEKEETLDNITLFSIITIMSFLLTVPVTLFVEGIKFTPSYLQSSGLSLREFYARFFLAGLCFHAYQQVSYMILARVSPVTHSVSNCVKRVVVIVSSVIFFKTPVSAINSLGTAVALAGVFLYSRVKRIKPKAE